MSRQPLATPYFSGGTGRSGTTVVAKLLDRHPDLARCVPWEARFLTDRFGLLDVVGARRRGGPLGLAAGLTVGNPAVFERRLRGPWFRRLLGDGKERGLYQGVGEDDLAQALAAFRAGLRQDADAAGRRLVHDLLDVHPRRRGRPRWIETSPDNALRAHELVRLFPGTRILVMQRDGRDTAASVAGRYWGPDDLEAALRWWERRSLAIHRSLVRAPSGQVLVVQLEDLVLRRREETLARILDFLGLDHAPEVVGFHAEHMRPEHAHLQRWREGLDAEAARAFDVRYEQALDRLRGEGVAVPV